VNLVTQFNAREAELRAHDGVDVFGDTRKDIGD
jgi:hypothetical protein